MDGKDWELLKALHEVKSAAKAADKIFLSQPAVTYRMKKMEAEMKTQLFIKNNRGIGFTSAGERLLSYANKMSRQYDEILEWVRNEEGIVRGPIRIGAPPFFASRYLPALFREFNSMYPQAMLMLYSGLSSELIELLRREEILLSVVRGKHPWEGGEILLFEETIKIVHLNPFTLEELPSIPFIDYRADSYLEGQINSWWLENFSVQRNILIHTYNSSSCIHFVKEGLGFSVLPSISIPNDEGLFTQTIVNIKGVPYVRPTRLLYYKTVLNLDVYRVFIDFLRHKMTNGEPFL
jgi:DNA-binding transcriptional LysR family regulator